MKNNKNINVAVFTVCNINYLPKALVLGESLYNNNNINLKIFVFDKKQKLDKIPKYISLEWVEDLGLENWKRYAFLYDIIEFSTSLKPYISIKLLKDYEKVIFFLIQISSSVQKLIQL